MEKYLLIVTNFIPRLSSLLQKNLRYMPKCKYLKLMFRAVFLKFTI